MSVSNRDDQCVEALTNQMSVLTFKGGKCKELLRECHRKFNELNRMSYGMKEDDQWIAPMAPSQADKDSLRLAMFGKVQYVHKRLQNLLKEFVSLSRAIETAQKYTYRHAIVRDRLLEIKAVKQDIFETRKATEMKRRLDNQEMGQKRMKLTIVSPVSVDCLQESRFDEDQFC